MQSRSGSVENFSPQNREVIKDGMKLFSALRFVDFCDAKWYTR